MQRIFIPVLQVGHTQPGISLPVVWLLVLGCGTVTIIAFIAMIMINRQSRKAVQKEVSAKIHELKTLIAQSHMRMRKLDSLIIEQLNALSPRGQQGFNMLKQIIGVLEKRVIDVERVIKSGQSDSIFKAHDILNSDIDNVGNGVDNLIFAEDILKLKPDQFDFAIDMMFAAVEADLTRPKDVLVKKTEYAIPRKRKFTIRGFLRSITGGTD